MMSIFTFETHCPFCGSDDIDPSFARGYERGDMTQPTIAAGCNSCGATGPTVRVPDHSTGYAEAADKWDDRSGLKDDKTTTTRTKL